ncbi:MAG: DUF4301 family protein [Bacteroidales bacterium]|nr:DUF4301 family protein [Bacteroidales bacterium]
MFTKEDIQQIKDKNIELKTVEKQLENFRKGFPYIRLIEPATIGNGIIRFRKPEIQNLSKLYDKEIYNYKTTTFIPASGAATRMFKDLIAFYENDDLTETLPKPVQEFFDNLKFFAFYDDLNLLLKKDKLDLNQLLLKKDYKTILTYLLFEKGLNYSKLPKALIKFHKYSDFSRTSMEEHLIEAAYYCKNNDNNIDIHFTIADDFYNLFKDTIFTIKDQIEKQLNVTYKIDISVQKPYTDILAVDLNYNPLRDKDGKLVFRPGGHGALIENLNDCDSDIIFIKNIDNITPDKLKKESYIYKKVLGGFLIKQQQKLAEYLEMLEDNKLDDEKLTEIEDFTENSLFIKIDKYYYSYNKVNKTNYLYYLLNRPIRICGMVRNTGEPGGGPFWIKEKSGAITLQIIETSQIDLDNKKQAKIFKQSSHFNPVDIACYVRNYKGDKFDLTEFIDPETGFISVKSKDGKEIKVQELPGLWNGAMSDWITIFIEVPLITFNPVKTINDLLRDEHQC